MYKIVAINNSTHQVTISIDNGEHITFTIPDSQSAPELKKHYIDNMAAELSSRQGTEPGLILRMLKWLRTT